MNIQSITRFLIILGVLSSLALAEYPFRVGEKLIFTAGFRFFAAGEATLELTADTLNNSPVYLLTNNTQTNSFLDRFYRVRDQVKVWIDTTDLSLIRQEKRIQEGRYNSYHLAWIDTVSMMAITEEDSIPLPGRVLDPLSAIYNLRGSELVPGEKYQFTTYDGGTVREVLVRVTEKDKVSVPLGIFKCLVVKPAAADNRQLLKNEGRMKIWFTDDENRYPVRIEQKTNVGTMVMELQRVEYPPDEESDESSEDAGDIIIEDKDK